MNEHSSLVLPAHLLIKQPLGQPHTPSHPLPTLLFQFPLLRPSLWGSPYPLPAAQATCSLCTDEEELAHCFWQACSTKPALTAVHLQATPIGKHRVASPYPGGMSHACTEAPSL